MKENVNTNSKKFNRLFATVFAAIFALGIGFIGCDMTDDLSGLVNNDGSDQKTGGGASTPTATPGAGTYANAQNVTLETTTEGADIYYTLDGTDPTTESTKYTGPVAIGESKTLKAIAVKADLNNSAILTAAYVIEKVGTLSASASGTVAVGQPIMLETATEGAIIYYTIDGTTPSSASTLYNPDTGVIINANLTLKAIATKDGWEDSEVLEVTYTVSANVAVMPTASVVTGTYHENQSVTLETTAPGGTIRYTLDNTAPNDSSPVYGSAIEIDRTVTLKAITVKEGMITSQPMTVIYTLTPETPTANPPSGTYHEVQTVTLATATSGAEIYYTTDYSDPAASTTKYTGSISINVTTTVRAIAKKTGWTNSTEFTALYTLQVQPPAVLTVEVALAVTDNNTSKTDISVGLSGSGANQTMTLSVVEEPVVYFVVSKEAGQTITVSDDEANHVTMVTSGDLDGSTAGDDGVLFGVNMEDLLFDGAFGETDSFNANVIPSGTETRTFTLTVAETGKTSRTIAVSLNITLDQTTETSIYHREGTEGAYHYVKVRDAKLTAADRTAQSTTASLEAMETGPVTDLQNAFVWVDRHGEAGDNHNGYENGTTEGYSEYRLFVKKSQEIGKMCFMIVNTPGKRISSKWQDIDLRENISIELYGAGLPGVTTTTQGREQKITRNATFSTDPAVQALNGTGNGVKSGFLSVTNNYTAKYKALVLGKNITIAGDGSNNPVSISGEGPWKMLAASTLIYVAANGMLIMHDHSKVTDYYTEEAYSPIQVAEVTSGGIFGKFYMYGGIITGNTFGNSVGVIKAFHTETSPVIFLKGGIIENNTNNDVIR